MLSLRAGFRTIKLLSSTDSQKIDINESESRRAKPEKNVHLSPDQIPRPISHKLRRDPIRTDIDGLTTFETPGYHDFSYHRLYDYYTIQKMVSDLPTITEKINFVNPYERPWKRDEKKWHRETMRNLHSPRKAYALPHCPAYFDVLNYYGYVTKTAVLKQDLNEYYEDLNLPTGRLEERVKQSIFSVLEEENANDVKELSEKAVDRLLRAILDDSLYSMPEKFKRFADFRVSHNPRSESFWIRAGYAHLYQKEEVDGSILKDRRFLPKLVADHRQKLGELAFTMRDQLAANVRVRQPLRPLVKEQANADLESTHLLDSEPLLPRMYNLHPDADPLWQCPGYEPDSGGTPLLQADLPGETHMFGKVAWKNTRTFRDRLAYWKMDDLEAIETNLDLHKAQAIASLFNWTNAQAHCLGFTQYNDLDRPITSQLLLSDGQEFSFGVGQLNTLAFNIQVNGFVNNRVNFVSFKEPMNLFDEVDVKGKKISYLNAGKVEDGLNPNVLQLILRQLCV